MGVRHVIILKFKDGIDKAAAAAKISAGLAELPGKVWRAVPPPAPAHASDHTINNQQPVRNPNLEDVLPTRPPLSHLSMIS